MRGTVRSVNRDTLDDADPKRGHDIATEPAPPLPKLTPETEFFWAARMLGFCGPGEAAYFVDGGSRIALYGQLPLNTVGGQLSSGRLHGYGHLFEACTPLSEHAQAGRQVQATGGGPHDGCLLLTS